jgi:hypothetical protein
MPADDPTKIRNVAIVGQGGVGKTLVADALLFASGSNSYRGLKLSFQRRSSAGLSLNGNYTLSRCFGLDWANTGGTSGGHQSSPGNPDVGQAGAHRAQVAQEIAPARIEPVRG